MQKTKKSQQNNEFFSTNKLMKSKYPDSKNSQAKNAISSKIMLTDLCAQQKAKIGELIKTLQQRKKQNQDLQQQLNSWKSNYLTLQKVKTQLQSLIQNKNKQLNKVYIEIEELNTEKVQKDIQLKSMQIQIEKFLKKNNLKETDKINLGINTQIIEIKNSETQTKEKRKKVKERQVQVNTIDQIGGIEQRQTRKNSFYQPNSKSFDKIMKGQRLVSSGQKDYQTAVFRQDNEDQDYSNNKKASQKSHNNHQRQSSHIQSSSNTKGKALKPQQLYDYKNWSEYDQQQNHPQNTQNQQNIQVEDTENEDDEFQILAKKWLQLKQKNIQQISEGYYFNETDQNVNAKSLGIQSKLNRNKHPNQNGEDEQIDDIQLNRALKQRDFSASRLLNSKSKRNISENSDKKSLQNSQASYKNQASQISKKKNSVHIPQPKNPSKLKVLSQQNSKGVDFYSADLLDLVQEINK